MKLNENKIGEQVRRMKNKMSEQLKLMDKSDEFEKHVLSAADRADRRMLHLGCVLENVQLEEGGLFLRVPYLPTFFS